MKTTKKTTGASPYLERKLCFEMDAAARAADFEKISFLSHSLHTQYNRNTAIFVLIFLQFSQS